MRIADAGTCLALIYHSTQVRRPAQDYLVQSVDCLMLYVPAKYMLSMALGTSHYGLQLLMSEMKSDFLKSGAYGNREVGKLVAEVRALIKSLEEGRGLEEYKNLEEVMGEETGDWQAGDGGAM